MNIGHKVVRMRYDSEYGPATFYAYQGFRYKSNLSTMQGDKGPMAVFNSLSLAQQFANDLSHLSGITIFKVQYEQSNEDELWKKVGANTLTKKLSNCPRGTVLASSVTLEEEVSVTKSFALRG